MSPSVSVVIPTRNRPELVSRAVRSALAQTHSQIEVIVVIDGPDLATAEALAAIADPRLLVIELPASVGGSEVRNTGFRASRGEWIAFLDDDDEWLPEKTARQLAAAPAPATDLVFVASRYIERSHTGDRILPVRSVSCTGPFSEFLFCRESLRGGTGYVQTSTWFVSRPLMQAVPFTKGLPRNQDVDWMVHAMAQPGARLHIVEEPLAIFYEHSAATRVSKRPDWKFQYDWAAANRAYLTPKAFSFCIATLCIPDAMRQKESLATIGRLFAAAVRQGRMTAMCFGFFVYNLLTSPALRARIRRGEHAAAAAPVSDVKVSA